MALAMTSEEQANLPWVVLRLNGAQYAIPSRWITAILEQPKEVVMLPEIPPNVKGALHLWGTVVPLLDLRCLFGMQSVDEEVEAYRYMIEERKQDHIHWVEELQRCYQMGDTFHLATDPHQCAFGKWYDHFHSESLALVHELSKIEEPHRKLHETANQVFRAGVTAEQAEALMREAETILVPQIVTILDESVRLYEAAQRAMVVALNCGTRYLGLLVDEVLAVEQLELITPMTPDPMLNKYVCGIAKSEKQQGEILMLADSLLLTAVHGLDALEELAFAESGAEVSA